MAMKLYGAALSPFVRKTRVFMQHKGIDFEAVHVDPNNPPDDYAKINPLKRIPALEHDGRFLADSAVICQYLERIHPDSPLYPSDPYEYARCLWFEKFADYEVARDCTFAVFRNRIVMRLIGKECNEELVQKALAEKVPPLFEYLNGELEGREFLVGDQMSIADIALASQLVNFSHGGEKVCPDSYPNLAAHTARMHELTHFAKAIEKESGFVSKVLDAG
jgi:glutathione S-transferase